MNTFIQFKTPKYAPYEYGVLTMLFAEAITKMDEFDDYTDCGMLFSGVQDVKITLENGEIFSKELNQWVSNIEFKEPIVSEKCLIVRTFDKTLISGKTTGIYNNIEIEDTIDVLPELVRTADQK